MSFAVKVHQCEHVIMCFHARVVRDADGARGATRRTLQLKAYASLTPCISCAAAICQLRRSVRGLFAHDGRSAKFRQIAARFRLYRHRSLQEKRVLQHFSKSTRLSSWKFWNLAIFCKFCNICKILLNFHENYWFSNWFFAKILRLQRCKSMQIL